MNKKITVNAVLFNIQLQITFGTIENLNQHVTHFFLYI